MATPDRLRLFGDDYGGVPEKLLRDLNRMFESRDTQMAAIVTSVEALDVRVTALENEVADILARLLAAGIP